MDNSIHYELPDTVPRIRVGEPAQSPLVLERRRDVPVEQHLHGEVWDEDKRSIDYVLPPEDPVPIEFPYLHERPPVGPAGMF